MVEDGIPWIYLIFFMIPLVRILPRIVRKLRGDDNTRTKSQFSQKNLEMEQRHESVETPQTKDMQVLGELNKGVKDFNKIQSNLGIDNQKLEIILNSLEDQGLMKVIKKKGLVGIKVELYPTDKGFKKYYS